MLLVPPPPYTKRDRAERIARKAMMDGFKDAAFENAVVLGDPRIPTGVSGMGVHKRRSIRNAWWQLAIIDSPELLVMAHSNSLCIFDPAPVQEAEPICEAEPVCEARQPSYEAEIPRGYRSIEHAARIALSIRITTRLKNPGARFKYQTATARYVRRFLPSDDPTLEQMQDAYNEIGKLSGHKSENIIQARYEMIKHHHRHEQAYGNSTSELQRWWAQRAGIWLANAESQLRVAA